MKEGETVVFTQCIEYSMYNYDLTINKQYKVIETCNIQEDNHKYSLYIRVLNDINEETFYIKH